MKTIWALAVFVTFIGKSTCTYCDRLPREDLNLDQFFTKLNGKLKTYKTISTVDRCVKITYHPEEKITTYANFTGHTVNYTLEKTREGQWHRVNIVTGEQNWLHTFAWGEDEADGFICMDECDCNGGYSHPKYLACSLTSSKFVPHIDHILKKLDPMLWQNDTIHECNLQQL